MAWIVTRIPSYVDYLGSLEGDQPSEHRPYVVHAVCESQVTQSDEGKVFFAERSPQWPAGNILAHAGRELLAKILAEVVCPMALDAGAGRRMRREEFVGLGSKETGGDWLDLDPQPQFSSAEIMIAFPAQQPGGSEIPPTSGPINSTAGAENECREWLANEFAADPDKRRSKDDFRTAALARFAGRLTARGFDQRVWSTLAQQAGRSGAGAKKKS